MSVGKRQSNVRRPGRVVAGALLCALGVLALLAPVRPAAAQVQLVEKVARVEVPVYEDNLDDAKRRAIHQGQQKLVMELVRSLVAETWVEVFRKPLEQEVLGDLDRYISSFRVQRLESSLDRTKYLAILSAQVNRTQLVEDLRALSLPLLTDPVRRVVLYYRTDDPVLGNATLRESVVERLAPRLALLNYKLDGQQPLPPAEATVLENPLGEPVSRERLLARQGQAEGLYVQFERLPPTPAGGTAPSQGGKNAGVRGVALLYHRGTGRLLGEFEHVQRAASLGGSLTTSATRDLLLQGLVAPLVDRMLPGAFTPAYMARESAELKLRVLGLRSVEDEEAFERSMFRRGSDFERFSLYMLEPERVTYQGPYSGDPRALENDLTGQAIGDFKVRSVYWYNDTLELEVERTKTAPRPPIKLFPPNQRPADVQRELADFFERYPQLEVSDPTYAEGEDNGWLNRANRLPFNTTVYGYVDARSDSDFFVGEALEPGEEIVLVWHRVGRTNLSPAVRIYDGEGVPVKTLQPRAWLRYVYTVPPGQHRFYVEVADRFGYLQMDTGGYLSFHYLLSAKRESPWGGPASTAKQ